MNRPEIHFTLVIATHVGGEHYTVATREDDKNGPLVYDWGGREYVIIGDELYGVDEPRARIPFSMIDFWDELR